MWVKLTDTGFQKAVNSFRLSQIWLALNNQFGNYQKLDSLQNPGKLQITAFLSFARATQPVNIFFNTQHQIVGFFLGQTHLKDSTTEQNHSDYPQEAFEKAVPGGTLKGTLTFPKQHDASTPIVMIIAGSGPTDQNGNSLKLGLHTDAYKILADSLAASGVASLRYDKRGIGESNNFQLDESKLRFETYVEDAVSIISELKQRFANIYILGHSEGSLIGMLAAQKTNPKGYISLAGPGENIASILKTQLSSSKDAQKADSVLVSLKSGQLVMDIPDDLQMIFHLNIQPYLISWMKYYPEQEIKKLNCPILILQGDQDLQVDTHQGEILEKNAGSKATLHIISGMNHILKNVTGDKTQNLASYKDPSLPINNEMLGYIIKFIKQ